MPQGAAAAVPPRVVPSRPASMPVVHRSDMPDLANKWGAPSAAYVASQCQRCDDYCYEHVGWCSRAEVPDLGQNGFVSDVPRPLRADSVPDYEATPLYHTNPTTRPPHFVRNHEVASSTFLFSSTQHGSGTHIGPLRLAANLEGDSSGRRSSSYQPAP
eukprot:6182710-Pleurochrysis_carterae.AAC.1